MLIIQTALWQLIVAIATSLVSSFLPLRLMSQKKDVRAREIVVEAIHTVLQRLVISAGFGNQLADTTWTSVQKSRKNKVSFYLKNK